jgi:hypothetical protein
LIGELQNVTDRPKRYRDLGAAAMIRANSGIKDRNFQMIDPKKFSAIAEEPLKFLDKNRKLFHFY